MEVLIKYFPLLGIVLNTAGVIMLALFSMPKDVLFKDGSEAFAVNSSVERTEYMKSKYVKHRILTIVGYVLLFSGITVQAIPAAIEAL
ncbi:hypothetical protein [Vibrio sp. M260121]|uniref:hypothetical protein n=1 Tax=Vibrio sp. M260121 TaxID=3020897 RepID=UPI002F3F9D8C